MSLFQNASYALSVANIDNPLPHSLGEIAFSGRSNAGKSSALNALVGHRRLAFVSKWPGRTQMINFFHLGGERYLVDLPGYGFARAPRAMRLQWDKLLGTYLRGRSALCGLALVMDIRHPLTELDRQLIGFFLPARKPVHVLLTKADKLSRAEAAVTLHAVRTELAALSPLNSVQLFSALNGSGIEEAEAVFSAWLSSCPVAALADGGLPITQEAAMRRSSGKAAPGAASPKAANKKPRAKRR